MPKIVKCKNCGKEFVRSNGKGKKYNKKSNTKSSMKNYMYCSPECYFQYHLKDILKKRRNSDEIKS